MNDVVAAHDIQTASVVPGGSAGAMTAGHILVVDDDAANVAVISRMMGRLGYTIASAAGGEAALDVVSRGQPDVVLLDVNMPGLNGFEVCRRLKGNPATRLIPVVLITALGGVADRLKGIDAGADGFLSKPYEPAELPARVRSLTRLKRYTDELDSAESVILSLARTIEARDPYTRGHCERLAGYATALGARLGLSREQQLALYRGGYLHDVGKVGISDAILLKRGPLDPDEFTLIQQHTVVGDSICRELRLLEDVSPIVRHHHERADGTGYPDRLSGDGIPLLAQLMSIVDTYDAVTTERPYKAARTSEQACGELRADARKGWKDARLVEEFVSIVPGLTSSVGRQSAVNALGAVERWRS
jgi:putative two-component system response regulator